MTSRVTTDAIMDAEMARVKGETHPISALHLELRALAQQAADAMPRKAVSRAKLHDKGVCAAIDGLEVHVAWDAGTVYVDAARADSSLVVRIEPDDSGRIGWVYESQCATGDAAKEVLSSLVASWPLVVDGLKKV